MLCIFAPLSTLQTLAVVLFKGQKITLHCDILHLGPDPVAV